MRYMTQVKIVAMGLRRLTRRAILRSVHRIQALAELGHLDGDLFDVGYEG
jgi:hypothetical protein